MSAEYVVKTIAAQRLVGRKAALTTEQLSGSIGPMFDAIGHALTEVGGSLATPIATYARTEDGMDVIVGYACPGSPPAGTEVIELPAASAVCVVHLGPMNGVQETWQELLRWVVDNGYGPAGPGRELYIDARSEDQSDWVTELQQPVSLVGHL